MNGTVHSFIHSFSWGTNIHSFIPAPVSQFSPFEFILQPEGMRRYRELMRINDLLEQDLRTLKETDFMGPTTRAEFNRRKAAEPVDPISKRERKMVKAKYDYTKLDEIRKQPKSEQLRIMRVLLGGH